MFTEKRAQDKDPVSLLWLKLPYSLSEGRYDVSMSLVTVEVQGNPLDSLTLN